MTDRSVNCNKAKSVVKGFTQAHGIQFQETFALTVFNTIKVLLSLATNLALNIYGKVLSCYIDRNYLDEVPLF